MSEIDLDKAVEAEVMRRVRPQQIPMVEVGWTKTGDFWKATVKLHDRLQGIVPDYCALPHLLVASMSCNRNRAIAFALEELAAQLKATTYP